MTDKTDVSVTMPDDLRERIDSQLEYGDSRSDWIRKACERSLHRESETPVKN